MYYILGGSGLLGQTIKNIVKKKNYKLISRFNKKNSIKTNIFNQNTNYKKLKKENWLKKINQNDCIILLSNFGKIHDYEQNKKETSDFEKKIFFILKNINKKVRIIFLSSDMVYEGKKIVYKDNHKTNPINRYGLSKKKIENFILKNFGNYLILRLCKVFSLNLKKKSLVSELYSKVLKKKKINLFKNQFVHYIELKEFTIKFKKIINSTQITGVFNLPGSIFTNRYNLAISIFPKYKKYFKPINIPIKLNYLPKRLKMETKLY